MSLISYSIWIKRITSLQTESLKKQQMSQVPKARGMKGRDKAIALNQANG